MCDGNYKHDICVPFLFAMTNTATTIKIKTKPAGIVTISQMWSLHADFVVVLEVSSEETAPETNKE